MWKLFRGTIVAFVLAATAVPNTCCWAFSSVNNKPQFAASKNTNKNNQPQLEPGQVLVPSSASDPTQFDTNCVVNPVVLSPSKAYPKWQMYYYGNADGTWADGSTGFLPTGWCGLAESDDGIHWEKIVGPLDKGAILAPSENMEDWDSVHVGVGDVIRISDEELHMYFFGAGQETIDNFGPSKASYSGIRMRIGRAKSLDQGRTWERMGMVLDYDESEGLFASWPRILRPINDKNNNKPWQMLYHAFDGSKWRIFGATSTDQGNTWKRRGLLLDTGTHKDSFDLNGVGTRAVTSPWRGGALMVYEGVDPKGKHRLGAAFNLDKDGAGEWTKLQRMLLKHEGGPVAEPGKGAMGAWTSSVIGTPYLITMPDGSLRMYHCGKSGDKGHSIGLVVSEHADVTPDFWKPVT